MEEALFAMLYGTEAIKAKVSDRIWPLEREQGSKLPAITFQRASGVPDYDMQGATGLVESRYLVMCWGEKVREKSAYKVAKELARLVSQRFTPAAGFPEIQAGQEIQLITINNEGDSLVTGATGNGLARVVIDCTFWHRAI